jgi:hypothetical protein
MSQQSALPNPLTPSSAQSISSSQHPNVTLFDKQYSMPTYTPEQLFHHQQQQLLNQ